MSLKKHYNDRPFGHPGIAPRWTSSAKDGIVTAFSTSSRVWATVSHGILNEVYYPTIDKPQIRDLQFLITDGVNFVHEEKRDLNREITCISCSDGATLAYRIVNADPEGRYRITKEIIADSDRDCVLMHAHIDIVDEWEGRLQLYVLLAPHIGGGGWGNYARSQQVAGKRVLIAWKDKVCVALGVDQGFVEASCGYVGYSDGWQDLKKHFHLKYVFDEAEDGNIAVIGQVDIATCSNFVVGLAFGDQRHAAVTTLSQALSVPFPVHKERFLDAWQHASGRVCDLSSHTGDKGLLYRVSHNVLLAHEDKTYRGAHIASASIPWGDAKGDEDLGGYHLVWARDMVQTALALLACGDTENPRRSLIYLACSQKADGSFPQNFWLNGEAYWSGIQLDEVAFPIILAWRLWQAKGLGEFDPLPMVKAAAAFLVRQGPTTQQERWEEAGGYSPSTLAATIAALICAADFVRAHHDVTTAHFLEDYADYLESHIEQWTVTTKGTLVPGITRHYIRILPVELQDNSPNVDPNTAMVTLSNQRPEGPCQFPAREIVDAGFLELVRYGIRYPEDVLIEDSLRVVDAVLKVETPFGPCWHRYNHDGYGDGPTGQPFLGWGQGRAWPLLTGERGHYELAAGRDPQVYIRAIEGFASEGGMLPEQIWDEDHPDLGMTLGRPAGSAMPLAWAHAEYIKLVRSATDGRVFDRVAPVAARYLNTRRRKPKWPLEYWKPIHQVREVVAGCTLRIMAPAAFVLHWSADEWTQAMDTPSKTGCLGIAIVDIPVRPEQRQPIRFTFFWTESTCYPFFSCRAEQWEGHDYCVVVRPATDGV
ncbi:MAG: glycoside hydrolase family 15 protein [Acidiferrobacter sp.]